MSTGYGRPKTAGKRLSAVVTPLIHPPLKTPSAVAHVWPINKRTNGYRRLTAWQHFGSEISNIPMWAGKKPIHRALQEAPVAHRESLKPVTTKPQLPARFASGYAYETREVNKL